MWRLEETDVNSKEVHWAGLMSIYVDDLLVTAEDGAAEAAIQSIADVWAISEIEKAEVDKPVKYCGFEIEVAPDLDGFLLSQRKYEQEMLQRWNVTGSVDHPSFKLCEGDEDPDGPIDQDQIKTAQAIAGALLRLNTRTRPDISVGVSTVCRLATKNPAKAIEVGMNVMAYIRGNPGGLQYSSEAPKKIWGERSQLKIARRVKLLEVFSDIAYGTGSRGRSIQGMAIFFAGAIISWQTAVQPFVTHSTAESELVAYCDALNAGRSTEAMLATMMGVPCGSNAIERVMYGDNVAAIGLAHGTSSASWRTRHLRIRSSYLREALEGRAPGGLWRLLHLKGVELVADGLTKPLLGQAFSSFLTDLGMRRERNDVEPQGDESSSAAVAAMMVGSLLLSGMDAAEETDGDADSATIWACGAVLMAFGAIYVGQLAVRTMHCCLRRLQGPSQSFEEDNRRSFHGEAETEGGDRIRVKRGKGSSSSQRGSTTLNITIQSGSQHDDGLATSPLPSSSAGDLMSGTGAVCSATTRGSGTMGRKSGVAVHGSSHGERAAGSMSSSCPSTSGLASAAEAAESSPSRSGSAGAVGPRNVPQSPQRETDIKNPWNKFQHEWAGKGFSKKTLTKMYHYYKEKNM